MNFAAKTGIAALCAMAIGVAPVHAQTPAATQADPTSATYQQLLTQGFEVKTVLVLSEEVSTRVANAVQPDTVMALLQKGPVTASCWVTLASWSAQNIGGVSCNVLH